MSGRFFSTNTTWLIRVHAQKLKYQRLDLSTLTAHTILSILLPGRRLLRQSGTAERHASMPCCATKPVVEGDVPEHAVTVQRKDALLEHGRPRLPRREQQ
jgi:hypothetical protein